MKTRSAGSPWLRSDAKGCLRQQLAEIPRAGEEKLQQKVQKALV